MSKTNDDEDESSKIDHYVKEFQQADFKVGTSELQEFWADGIRARSFLLLQNF